MKIKKIYFVAVAAVIFLGGIIAALATAWNVSDAVWVRAFDLSDKDATNTGIAFNADGTKMFVSGATGKEVNEYHLSTGFDVSTAEWDSLFYVGGKVTYPSGIAFNTDGSKMYINGIYVGFSVYEYHLSTDFDVSTATYDSEFYFKDKDDTPNGIAFNADGSKMYMVGKASDNIHEYNLSTDFDVSTATWDSLFYVGDDVGSPNHVAFNSDGTVIFVLDNSNDQVVQYNLSTGFDISTADYDSEFYTGDEDSNPYGLACSPDGTKMFITGYTNKNVDEYSLVAEADEEDAMFFGVNF